MIDHDALRALAQRLRIWWTPPAQGLLAAGHKVEDDIEAAAGGILALLDEIAALRARAEQAEALLREMRAEHKFHHYYGCPYDEAPDVPCDCYIGALHAQVDAAIDRARGAT